MDYAINYFRDKSDEMVQTYTDETTKLFTQYNNLRLTNMAKDKYLAKSSLLIIDQEKIINELRTFIEVYLSEMLDFVELEQNGVCQKYI